MLYDTFNCWYARHGWGKDYFGCKAEETRIFYDIYNDLAPGKSIAVFDKKSSQILGACFYHPREQHVSLGIMAVHKDYCGRGIGRLMVDYILKFTKDNNYKSCRLVGSAINMDSFSLYNRSGFVPRVSYNDMVIDDAGNKSYSHVAGEECVREAGLKDVHAMGDLEMEISAIRREIDYRYAIVNPRKALQALVYENREGQIDGFMISVKHPALNMIGPCVARSEDIALALIRKELERFKGAWVLMVIPMQMRKMIEQVYAWGGRNVETHLKQVWGQFQPFRGVNMPSFLPETG